MHKKSLCTFHSTDRESNTIIAIVIRVFDRHLSAAVAASISILILEVVNCFSMVLFKWKQTQGATASSKGMGRYLKRIIRIRWKQCVTYTDVSTRQESRSSIMKLGRRDSKLLGHIFRRQKKGHPYSVFKSWREWEEPEKLKKGQ